VTVDRARLAAAIDRERDLAARGVRRGHERPAQPPGTPASGFELLAIDGRITDLLAAHDGPAGIIPSVPRLAGLLGVSARYVRQRIAAMEAAGLVERVPVFEADDDQEWQRRGRRPSHPRRQTSNTYRLATPRNWRPAPAAQFRGPPGTPTNLVGKASPQVNPPELGVPDSPVRSALEGKEGAGGGYRGREEDESALSPAEPTEVAIEPPAALQLDHDPGVSEVLATLGGAFGPVQVLAGPATYQTARGRIIDLAAGPASDLHQAVEQLDRHTCRRANGGPERCAPGRPCGRHQRRGRPDGSGAAGR
jgi:hypothetical protein